MRLLPTDVLTKQFDCYTARRISGSMLVTLVAAPKLAYHSLPRPSSTASVPNGVSQRSSIGLAFTLIAPPAAPVAAVCPVPVLIEPPPMLAQPASTSDAAAGRRFQKAAATFSISHGLMTAWVPVLRARLKRAEVNAMLTRYCSAPRGAEQISAAYLVSML